MSKVTIIGATGSLGQATRKLLLEETDLDLCLFSRSANRLPQNERCQIIAASTSDRQQLEKALEGANLVFVALSGQLPKMVTEIINAMKKVGTKRIILISSYGIYGEIEGRPQIDPILMPYRKAADLLESSDLDYTILRPGWFDNGNDRECQLIAKGKSVSGHDISRLAIANLVKEIALDSKKYKKENLAIVR
ncbi:NAD(P)-dependent oxidoreductase [Streptococcus bovimastitidis]|uniref:NAD(P)-dependent oxidoreductase n=1 Tax=Streptococcus bovimastitidis TaxID=1856638 RepID=A0A1L8MNU3_9STRE|nr:NAD(P)H-binding protein [Streptococcus bovimastitidis]OJF72440.1 NAD(P)-dependent oxidoreductase [Streptococcus bovimastitidis]